MLRSIHQTVPQDCPSAAAIKRYMSDMLLNVCDVAVYITATCVKRCINVIDWTDF